MGLLGLTFQERKQSIMAGKVWWQECKVVGCTGPTIRKKRVMLTLSSFSLFPQLRTPPDGIGSLRIQGGSCLSSSTSLDSPQQMCLLGDSNYGQVDSEDEPSRKGCNISGTSYLNPFVERADMIASSVL